MKGVSPLISLALIILITVSLASLINLWLTNFARTSAETIKSQREKEIFCSDVYLVFKEIKYCRINSAGYLYGTILNSGNVEISGAKIRILYDNNTINEFEICSNQELIKCKNSNLTLSVSQEFSFNFSLESNFDTVELISLQCPSVKDKVEREYVEFKC